MIAFIDDHREAYGGRADMPRPADRPSTYHEHVAQRQDPMRLSARAQQDQALEPEIARMFAENFGAYGVAQCLASGDARELYGRPLHH